MRCLKHSDRMASRIDSGQKEQFDAGLYFASGLFLQTKVQIFSNFSMKHALCYLLEFP